MLSPGGSRHRNGCHERRRPVQKSELEPQPNSAPATSADGGASAGTQPAANFEANTLTIDQYGPEHSPDHTLAKQPY